MLFVRLNAAAGPSRVLSLPFQRSCAATPPVAAVARRQLSASASVNSRFHGLAPGLSRSSQALPNTPPAFSVQTLASARWTSSVSTPTPKAKPIGTAPARPKLTRSQWPWYPVLPPGKPGTIEEERVIYARPDTMKGGRMAYWGFVVIFLGGVVSYIIIPSPQEVIDAGLKQPEDKWIMGLPEPMFWTYLTGGGIAVFSAVATIMFFLPSRIITRISLVRQRPKNMAAAPTREFLRVRHMGHNFMWGKRSIPREVDLKDVKINLILGKPTKDGLRRRSPWLRLEFTSPHHKVFSWDAVPSRLNFMDASNLPKEMRDEEIVLSLARIEDVFGTLKPVAGETEMPPKKADGNESKKADK